MAAATCDQGKGTPSRCSPFHLVMPTERDRAGRSNPREHADDDPGDGRATASATLRAPN
jgi:hypothetical protein